LSIQSEPEAGTVISVKIPLNKQQTPIADVLKENNDQ